MNLVVDTSVWSLLLRRKEERADDPHVQRLRYHLEKPDAVHMPGLVLTELLDGVRNSAQFDLLEEYLRPFPVIQNVREDFIEAARLKNHCRSRGVQAGSVDFLIAATCVRRNYPLLTADMVYSRIARHCALVVLPV